MTVYFAQLVHCTTALHCNRLLIWMITIRVQHLHQGNQHDTTVCMPLGHSLRSSDQAAQPLEKLQCNETELVALVMAQLYSSTAQEPVMYTIATQTTQPCLAAHGSTRTAQTLHTPRGNETPPDDFYIYYPCTHQLSPVTCA
jgi:hypothetical protein